MHRYENDLQNTPVIDKARFNIINTTSIEIKQIRISNPYTFFVNKMYNF